MNEPLVYLNGAIVPQSRAYITLHDAGFVMGATVTDLCRTFRHQLYRFDDHLARFGQSCRAIEVTPPLSDDDIRRRARELVEHNIGLLEENDDLALVLFCTPGPISYYLGEEGTGPVTFGMHTFPLPFARYRPWAKDGVSLVVPDVRHVAPECIDRRIKHRSRLFWWLADRQAQRQEPGAIALLRDVDGSLTETAGANLLLVQGRQVLSPPGGRILEGVSRQVVRELCPGLGYEFVERPLFPEDCFAADEAWLTSTPYCVVGIRAIQGRALPFPGPGLRRLVDVWSAAVGMKIHEQITAGV